MIPGPLVAPVAPEHRVFTRAAATSRLGGLALLLLALVAVMAWTFSLSPLRLQRWGAFETAHEVNLDQPGTYTLFEEDRGAPSRVGASPLTVTVRSIAGRPVPLRLLVEDSSRPSRTYDTGLHRGRAIVAIDIERPGRYLIVTVPTAMMLSPSDPPRNRREPLDFANLPNLALAHEGEPSVWGGLGGLLVLVGVPAVAGLSLLLVAGRRWPVPPADQPVPVAE